jgi:Zn-dependent protease
MNKRKRSHSQDHPSFSFRAKLLFDALRRATDTTNFRFPKVFYFASWNPPIPANAVFVLDKRAYFSASPACKPQLQPLRFSFGENSLNMNGLTPEVLAQGFIWFVAFLFSTTCHEAAHAVVAKIGGDETAAEQVTLNPVPHMQREPWGMIVVPIITLIMSKGSSLMGWASAPFDPTWERRHPHRSAWMALAGPATNFTLMFLAVIGLRVGFAYHWLHALTESGHPSFAFTTLAIFFQLNLLLGVFNLLPAPPLDGSTGIMLLMNEKTAHRYLDWLRSSPYVNLSLLIAILVMYHFYAPVENFVTRLLLG